MTGPAYVNAWAEFHDGDPNSRWRYVLARQLTPRVINPRAVAFVMLNPSTATGEQDDPTIRRCADFARQWQFDQLLVVNLFAYRSTDPAALRSLPYEEAVGPENDSVLRETAIRSDLVVAAWGVHGKGRGREVAAQLRQRGVQLYHLGLTKDGQPRHPLYLRRATLPQHWEAA